MSCSLCDEDSECLKKVLFEFELAIVRNLKVGYIWPLF